MQAPGGWEVQPAEPPDACSQGPPRMKSGPICSFLLEKPVSSAGKHKWKGAQKPPASLFPQTTETESLQDKLSITVTRSGKGRAELELRPQECT